MSYSNDLFYQLWKKEEEEKNKKKNKYGSNDLATLIEQEDPAIVYRPGTISYWRKDEDIAPVRDDKPSKSPKLGDDKVGYSNIAGSQAFNWNGVPIQDATDNGRKWFNDSWLDDGFQWSDLKAIPGSVVDIGKNLGQGILGIGEKLVDFGAVVGTKMNEANMMQSAQSEMMLNAISGDKTDAKDVLSKYTKAQDEMEKEVGAWVAKDLYDEAAIAKAIISDPVKWATGLDSEKYSVFGEKSDALAVSGGQLLADIGANAILPGSGMALMGVTAFGSEAESALQNGATLNEAFASAAISAGAEMLTEKLGGISFGGNTLTDAAVDALSKKITGKLGKVLLTAGKFGANATAEGFEELASGYMSAIGQQMTYMDDKEIEELFSNEDKLESFIGGIVLGGVGEVGDVARAKSKGVSYVTGLTKNEEAVVKKEIENRIAEQEKNGKVLTGKEKSKIADRVREDLERGYISTDTIESVLGGDSYKAYKDAFDSENALVEQEKALTKEYNALNKNRPLDMTGEEWDRRDELKALLPELRAKIKANEASGNTAKLKSKLFSEVDKLTANDTKLRESYNELARASQDFVADFDKYKGTKHEDAVRKTLESAIKSGANNTNRVHDIVDMATNISAESGKVIEFKTDEDIVEAFVARQTEVIAEYESIENRTAEQDKFLAELKEQLEKVKSGDLIVDGDITGDNIVLNIGSKDPNKKIANKPLNRIIGHEVTHSLEQTKAYEELRDTLFAYAKSKGIDTDAKIAELKLKYAGIKDANPEAELVADLVGDYLFTGYDFARNLTAENRNLAQRIYDKIKHLYKMATAGSKEARELERAKYAFEEAFRESNVNEATDAEVDDVQYSISVTDKNTLDSLNEQVAKGEYDAEKNPDGGYYVTYKSMSFWGYDKDGNAILRSPMAEYVDGELSNAYLIPKDKSKLNWYQSTETIDDTTGLPSGLLVKAKKPGNKSYSYLPAAENQDLIADDWSNLYFNLKKKVQKNGKWVDSDVPARYNPYEHSSNSMLNDQFSTAYLRDNLVTVKMYVPVSEDNGAFRAKWSKDPTGWTDWKSGTVAGKINKQKDLQRKVFLSRYAAPVEIVSDSEVAQAYKGYVEGTDVSIPDNVVSPGLLTELKKAGVPVTESGKVKYSLLVKDKNGNISTVNPYVTTREQSSDFMVKARKGELNQYTYFPVRAHTPGTIIATLNNAGIDVTDKPLAMQAKKARQSQIDGQHTEPDGTIIRHHAMSTDEIQEAIDKLNDAFAVIHQTERTKTIKEDGKNIRVPAPDNFVFFVTLDSGKECVAVIEFDSIIDKDMIQKDGYGDDYHTTVTVFEPDEYRDGEPFDYLEYLAVKPSNHELEITKESPKTETAISQTEATVSEMELSENKVAQEDENVKTQFSLSVPVEETKNLVALHNLTADKLAKSLELGGLPMPSLAITKADIPHSNFGEITLVFGKETIDPKANKKNKVYSADAWTPIFPSVEYEADGNVVNRVSNKLSDLGNLVDKEFERDLSRIGYSIEDYLNRQGGEEGLIQYVMDNYGLKAAYLEDTGKHIEAVTKQEEVPRNFNPDSADKYMRVMEILGVNTAEEIWEVDLKEARDNHGAELEDVFPGITKSGLRMGKVLGMVGSYLKGKDSAPEYKTVTDSVATRKAVDDAIDAEGFEAWTRELFSGVEKDSGIYNNKDLFTPSGNRRSFKQTHLPVTLENIVKAMASQNDGNSKNVSGFNGVKTLRASTAETFKSIDEMHEREGRLQHLTQEQADEITDALQTRLYKVIEAVDNENNQSGDRNSFIRFDQIGRVISEIGEDGKYGVADIQSAFRQYGRPVSDDTAQEVKQLLYDVSQMPVNIFEAKPQRVVSFDEAKAFVIPNNVDAKLKQELLNRGYSIAEYDPSVEGDRQRVVNQFEEYRFSLSEQGEDIAPTPVGGYDFYGKDFRKVADVPIAEIAPVATEQNVTKAKNVPPVTAEAPTEEAQVADDIAPVNEATKRSEVESVVGNKDGFMSKRATELYEEITSLKKGVRASQRLGYLLDHGYDWRSIKTALLNIRDNPNQVVNPNSAAESVAREMLGREYDSMAEDFVNAKGVTGNIYAKMQSLHTELENNQRLREQSSADFDSEIARLQAEYDGKKNQNTKVANDILRRIERIKRLKGTVDADYGKRIDKIGERLEKMSKPEYKTAMQRKKKQAEYTSLMENLVGNTATWVDKKLGLSYKVNTLRRNLRDIVRDANGNPDIEKADAIYDELQGKYNHNEAELKRESMRIKDVFQKLNLNHAEDTYAHMLGEFRHNPDTKLTEDDLKEFFGKHKGKIDHKKVEKAIEESRKVFDELIVRVNERLKEQGMKEIPYRQGYFPHFTNPKQTWLHKFFNWKPVDNEIPTSIAGLTEEFNPQRSWQSFNKQRKGDTTDYSLEQGLDSYIHGALDWIYHIEDIQKRRALENHIRYVHSEEGVKKRIDEIRNNESYDADEMQQHIDAVYAEANNPLNNFVTDLRAGTNTLANKKSSMDRKTEEMTNRKIYSVMTNLNNRINANMVVGSFSSALTNFIPITQSWMEVSPVYSLKGMRDTIISTIRDDGVVNKSDFLTNRLMDEEKLYQTGWDKVSDKAGFMMDAIDSFTSQTVWRSKYLQNISEGMSEVEAIKNADQFAENVIAGRSRGNQPTIFDAKNPLTKIFTAFQLEVSNQYGYMFKDAPQDSKNKARLVKGYATAFLGAYAYNALYSSLVGRDAAFDPISILEDLFKDLFGDDEEEENALLNLAENVLDEVPFVGGLLGGGRIPLSSALPYDGDYKTFITDLTNGELSTKEMLKPIYYLAMPVAGGQIKKTNEGLAMFSDDHPVSGSYTESGNLRFPVEDTFGNKVQAAMFGQYASKNARDYFDNGRSPLKEKQIQEYIDVDIPIRDYWEYREGLTKQKTVDDKFDYIAGLDLPVSKKNILINNIVDRKEDVDMTGYEDFSSYDEFDFATKNPGKYAVSQVVGDYSTYSIYYDHINDLTADKDENGKSINGSRKEKVFAYIDGLPLDYGQKCILFKSQYKSDDSINMDIINYLDSREDIDYDEMVTILTELGFTVDGNNVYWD